MTAKLFQLELNELNFEFVQRYAARGLLPNLSALIERHGITETVSEQRYEHLEPWIQWVTAHSGLGFAEHGVFRLGDIVDHDITQIWEFLEERGLKVGAVSPMNARNRTRAAAFFVPDPWTATPATGGTLLHGLAGAISAAVNDNATARIGPRALGWLLAGAARYAPVTGYRHYLRFAAAAARGQGWAKAQILEELLADVAIAETQAKRPDYVTLFLNAGAHIQHHYMFNSAVYDGRQRNPDWLIDAKHDPLLAIFEQYDRIAGRIMAELPDYRLMIATGLHQDPYPQEKFYWRLRDHAAFLTLAAVPFAKVEPRMSRDFLIECDSEGEARQAEAMLAGMTDGDAEPLFEIDNRGRSLFVMLTYPRDISGDTVAVTDGRRIALRPHVAFVAIKNGEHNGIGYIIDTGAPATDPIALADLPKRIAAHFGHEWLEPKRNAEVRRPEAALTA